MRDYGVLTEACWLWTGFGLFAGVVGFGLFAGVVVVQEGPRQSVRTNAVDGSQAKESETPFQICRTVGADWPI